MNSLNIWLLHIHITVNFYVFTVSYAKILSIDQTCTKKEMLCSENGNDTAEFMILVGQCPSSYSAISAEFSQAERIWKRMEMKKGSIVSFTCVYIIFTLQHYSFMKINNSKMNEKTFNRFISIILCRTYYHWILLYNHGNNISFLSVKHSILIQSITSPNHGVFLVVCKMAVWKMNVIICYIMSVWYAHLSKALNTSKTFICVVSKNKMHLTRNKAINTKKTCKYFPLGPYICKNKSILFAFDSNVSYDINTSTILENTAKVFFYQKCIERLYWKL